MQPKVVELDIEQLNTNLDQIEQAMGEATSRPFRTLLGAYTSLLQMIQEKNINIARLRRMLFGAHTERTPVATASAASPTAPRTGHG